MKSKSKQPASTPRIATYYRKSSDIQEASIDRQKSSVVPFAQREGWNVVEAIEDDGISGSEVAKRPGIQRILQMVKARQIDGILVDDFDRLLRLDMLDMGELLAPLRRAGIWIHSVAQGRFDFQSMAGRLVMGVTSEAKHGELLATARRSLTEHLRQARDLGSAPLPRTVYGYVRVDDMDRPLDKRGKRPGKWIIDAFKSGIVRQIFAWYIEGRSINGIARELERRAVRSPSGSIFWYQGTVRLILRNPAYIGDRAFGRMAVGKFFHLENGEVVPTIGQAGKGARPKEEWIVSTGTHEGIIDRDVFAKAQGRLDRVRLAHTEDAEGRVIRRGGESTTPGGDRGKYILSRLLVCGQCGTWMCGFVRGRGVRCKAYKCAKYIMHGKRGCVRCEVREEPILRRIIEEVRNLISPKRRAWLRDRLQERLQAMKSDEGLASLRKQIRAEETILAKCRVRIGEVSPDMVCEVESLIREARERLRSAQEEVNRIEASDPVRDLETTLKAAEEAMFRLEEAIDGDHREMLREALHGIIERVIVRSEVYDAGKGRMFRRPAEIEVILRRGTGLDTISTLGQLPLGNVPSLLIRLIA